MKKQIQILIALLALSFAAWGQSDRVKTVEVPDSASMIVFDNTGTNIDSNTVQGAIEQLGALTPRFTPGIIPMTQQGDSLLTEDRTRLNWNSYYNRMELGSYPAEGSNNYIGIPLWHQNGSAFSETFLGPGELYVNNWITGTQQFLDGIELLASGSGGRTYRRHNSAITTLTAVPNNALLSQIRFKNNYGTGDASQITPFGIYHVSTTGTSRTGGRLYFSIATSNPITYADVTSPGNVYMYFDRATRAVSLNNTYNGTSRDDSSIETPTRPTYTTANGIILQAPIGKFQVENRVTNTTQGLQTTLDSIFSAIPKHSATLYQSTLRQYTFTQDTITIDTLSNALMTDSITQDTGYIRNISSDTMRWQVSYNFFRDSDEDALTSFMDITTDGGDIPEAIPGSRAYSEQAVTNGTQHAGPTFTVDVPPGAALRLCVYSISAAAGVDISDMTISVEEIYRE